MIDKVIAAIAEKRFLISTHGYVDALFKMKGDDYEKYLLVMEDYRKQNEPANPLSKINS